MKRFTLKPTLLALLALVLIVSPVLAYTYSAPYVITETGSIGYTMLATIVGSNNQWMADNGFMEADALDTRIETLGGSEKPHMVASERILAAVPVAANSQTNLLFTTGNADLSALNIITGRNGYIVIDDAAALEPGNNFEIDISGYIDTSYTSGESLVQKLDGAGLGFRVYVSAATDITASIYDWIHPTGFVDAGAGWNNENLAFDDNTATFAMSNAVAVSPAWSEWLELTYPAITTSSVRFWEAGFGTQIEVDIWYAAAWHNVYAGATIGPAWDTQVFAEQTGVTATRVRLQHGQGGPSPIAFNELEMLGGLAVTAAGVPVGEHVVVVSADGANLDIDVDGGTYTGTVALAGMSVPDNATDWSLMDNSTTDFTQYWDYYKHTVAGTLIAHYEPNTMILGQANTTYPEVASTSTNTTVAGTSHTVDLPGSVMNEDLLLVFFATTSNPTINYPSGWTSLFSTATGVNGTLSAAYRIADGSEGNTSIAVTTSASVTGSAQTFAVISYQGVPEVGTAVTGAGAANPDPPNLAPTWGATPVLWFALSSDDVNITVYPANYTDGALTGVAPYLASARRELSAAAENPGIFTAGAGNWVANTLAIRGKGTATFTNGSPNVVGAGTDWDSFLVGSMIESDTDTVWHTVSSVTDTTNLTLTVNYTAAGGAGHLFTTKSRLPDREGALQDGVLFWGRNPAGVIVALGSMVSSSQPLFGGEEAEPVTDVLPAAGTTDWFVEPAVGGALLTNPLRPFVTLMSDSTTITELQAWRILGLALVLMLTTAAAVVVKSHLLLAGIVAGAAIGGMVALTIFPLWALVFTVGAIIGGLVAERSPSL